MFSFTFVNRWAFGPAMSLAASLLLALALSGSAKACDPLGVCSQAVVENFGVLGSEVHIQAVVPTVTVRTFAVPTAVVVPQVFALNHVGCGAVRARVFAAPRVLVRQPRQVIRNKQVIRQR